jgi:chromate reductase
MKVLGIAGSLRKDSLNRKVLATAAEILREIDLTVEYTNLDLKELNLVVYDQDIQDAGMPENVIQLKETIKKTDILLICTPEYNHSIPGGLKNAVDWASRGEGNPFAKKVVAIMGATDGMGGTIRSQEHLRVALAALNAYVIPYPEVFIRNADEKLTEDGTLLADEKGRSQIRKLLERTIKIAERLGSNE